MKLALHMRLEMTEACTALGSLANLTRVFCAQNVGGDKQPKVEWTWMRMDSRLPITWSWLGAASELLKRTQSVRVPAFSAQFVK